MLTSRVPLAACRTVQAICGNGACCQATSSSKLEDVVREDLQKQMLDLVKARDLEYGIIIRRLLGNTALEAIRVYPDGHEESVRDSRVAEITVNSFKDILAVSKDSTVYTHAARDFTSWTRSRRRPHLLHRPGHAL